MTFKTSKTHNPIQYQSQKSNSSQSEQHRIKKPRTVTFQKPRAQKTFSEHRWKNNFSFKVRSSQKRQLYRSDEQFAPRCLGTENTFPSPVWRVWRAPRSVNLWKSIIVRFGRLFNHNNVKWLVSVVMIYVLRKLRGLRGKLLIRFEGSICFWWY